MKSIKLFSSNKGKELLDYRILKETEYIIKEIIRDGNCFYLCLS